jgi:iron complex transport system ATP-binding protein
MISGGGRELVLIAGALAEEPRVVVLDEPTASLDFGKQGRVLRESELPPEPALRSSSRPTIRTTPSA